MADIVEIEYVWLHFMLVDNSSLLSLDQKQFLLNN